MEEEFKNATAVSMKYSVKVNRLNQKKKKLNQDCNFQATV